jgi:hypothetical protein
VNDAVDPAPITRIIGVSSNESTHGFTLFHHHFFKDWDHHFSKDWVITGPLTLKLRAERSEHGPRIYTITVESRDHSGNASTRTVTVTVPHHR